MADNEKKRARFLRWFSLKRRMMAEQRKTHKKTYILYVVLRVLVIAIAVRSLFIGNYENVLTCVLTLLLFTVPSFVSVSFKVELPDTLETIVLLFIFAAEILGEISSFYTYIPFWDTMLHTMNGFCAAAVGFSMVDLLNRNSRFSFSLSPEFMALVSFCFSMTIGVLWEFFEWFADMFFGTDMQKDTVVTVINSVLFEPTGKNIVIHKEIESLVVNGEDWMELYGGYIDVGIHDTMKDLFVNFIGAVVFSVIGYLYVKHRASTEEKHVRSRDIVDSLVMKPVDPDVAEKFEQNVAAGEAERERRITEYVESRRNRKGKKK